MQKNRISVKAMVLLGLMVALNVVLGRFSIQIVPQVRISVLGFIPIAMAAYLLGPVYGALTGALGDIVNFFFFTHVYGPYFPGYTVTALLSGAWYGFVLHGKKVTWTRAALCIVPVILLGEMGLNSVWTYVLYGDTLWANLPMRLITNLIECPLKIALLVGMTRLLDRFPKSYLKL
ncbi:MAG: folate family ECF transporter S component [Clostridia bacterium]|nr:folate family ECF transporter S component [Clostridia bacterium]